MTTGAVVIRWGAGIPGREAKGFEVFGAAVERFEQYAKSGRIHSHKEYMALTGRAGGFMIAEGEIGELQAMLAEPETLALNAKAEAIVNDFEIQLYLGGTDQTVQETMGIYVGALDEMGYM
jgi:hypothetical protein